MGLKITSMLFRTCQAEDIMMTLQASRHAAEQKAQELSDQVDKMAQQSVEAAAESQSRLEAAIQKAAKEAETASVSLLLRSSCTDQLPNQLLHTTQKQTGVTALSTLCLSCRCSVDLRMHLQTLVNHACLHGCADHSLAALQAKHVLSPENLAR